ncbi:uncharacterized protein LOC128895522 [Hylaeus anthracinus]|uniref:uncharacterized protein LOC128895522 n=1 Tax=Hylaeus anthracinus TaxID=313031 RepID=UPI0023B8EE45|nr:uncharacterized protein LOC128895522 [Hylaeus anthracinus]XP_054014168.1 uncharacterized protein LOC128895522 [Hylaeus anthracinus]
MKLAAVLLLAFISAVVSSPSSTPSAKIDEIRLIESSSRKAPTLGKDESYSTSPAAVARSSDETASRANERLTSKSQLHDDPLLSDHAKPILNPKELLLQEIHTLDEEFPNEKTQEEVARTLKAEARRIRPLIASSSARPSSANVIDDINSTTEDSVIKKLLEAEDAPYEDDLNEDEEDESDSDSNSDYDDEINDDEEVMTQCPDYCRCAGEYAAVTTATCTKLVDEQSFSTGIAHLRLDNAEQISLGPHALRSRGLQRLESITITDTKIVELNQTAFNDVTYLFAVNLTRNGLQEIPQHIFQNNTQLNLLAISGNPLKHTQDSKTAKHGLFDAPSVTEFYFTSNGLTKLKRTAFARMPSLIYVNLKNNKLREIDAAAFRGLESLEEVDLSNNFLTEISVDMFYKNGLQTLRVAGNNLTTLSTIQAPKLQALDASRNKIKVIAKDDLSGMPLLDQLVVASNGLKKIHQHAFADLDQLTHLDVSDNKLTSWSEHHLRTNPRLQVLLMSDNPELETLPIFKTIDTIEYETFSIYRFECANCGLDYLENDTFKAMPAITWLNLSRNRLTGLPAGLLKGLSSLRVLDLSDNIINTLGNNMFVGATNLVKLSLAGNPLVTLQVSPFLSAPGLTKLDVSRCELERVWSEARIPLTSLRTLSVRENYLQRITVEELKATPKLVDLDLSHNPLNCDSEFNEAIQWLTDRGVSPMETSRHVNNYGNNNNDHDTDGVSQWTDLAKIVCEGINDGPPDRSIRPKEKNILDGLYTPEDSDPLLRPDYGENENPFPLEIDHGIKSNEEIEKALTAQEHEYEDFIVATNMEYQPWYTSAVWPVIIVIIIMLMLLMLMVHIGIYLARRKGRSPVIRPPMILRPGRLDNKNCGLVYKPLQEEIATPHAPKRGSFYSSSTFHYDKIVPESV